MRCIKLKRWHKLSICFACLRDANHIDSMKRICFFSRLKWPWKCMKIDNFYHSVYSTNTAVCCEFCMQITRFFFSSFHSDGIFTWVSISIRFTARLIKWMFYYRKLIDFKAIRLKIMTVNYMRAIRWFEIDGCLCEHWAWIRLFV